MKIICFHNQLSNLTAHKKARLEISELVISNPELFPELLKYCFQTEKKISYKAAWILELVCEKKLSLLIPYYGIFFKNIPKTTKDQALRPLSKICLFLTDRHYKKRNILLESKYKETIIECCFDWLITNQKVATEAYAMRSLYFLGIEFDWIHPELKIIIEQNTPLKTSAYGARGRMTIEKIRKFQNKKKQSFIKTS
ncbi:MAG: adenylosuccinate lyase [Flavobacteriaceae bacterium]|nr:adenylosuccinate lyase [Flavobacteriaceae bacterium]